MSFAILNKDVSFYRQEDIKDDLTLSAGRPKGSTSKYHIGSICGGSKILSHIYYEKFLIHDIHKISRIVLQCGECNAIYEIEYTLFTYMLKFTDRITCGCMIQDEAIQSNHKTDLERKFERAALKEEVYFQKHKSKDKRDKWLAEILYAYKNNIGIISEDPDRKKKNQKINSLISFILMTSDKNISKSNRIILEEIRLLLK